MDVEEEAEPGRRPARKLEVVAMDELQLPKKRKNPTEKKQQLQRQVKRARQSSIVKLKKQQALWGRKRSTKAVVKPFSLVRNTEEAQRAGFVYRRILIADIPCLEYGSGLAMIRNIGLDRFLMQPIPNLRKELCDEFISSFDPEKRSGMVWDQVVKLDAEAVCAAVGLPVGDADNPETEIRVSIRTREMESRLKRMLMDAEEKKGRGYDLGQLVYGEEVDVVAWVASALMTKMESPASSAFHYATPDILLALDKSVRDGAEMQWAGHLALLISKAVKKTKDSRIVFSYGEWLTMVIEHQLRAAGALQAPGTDGNVSAVFRCYRRKDRSKTVSVGMQTAELPNAAEGRQQLVSLPEQGNSVLALRGPENEERSPEKQVAEVREQAVVHAVPVRYEAVEQNREAEYTRLKQMLMAEVEEENARLVAKLRAEMEEENTRLMVKVKVGNARLLEEVKAEHAKGTEEMKAENAKLKEEVKKVAQAAKDENTKLAEEVNELKAELRHRRSLELELMTDAEEAKAKAKAKVTKMNDLVKMSSKLLDKYKVLTKGKKDQG